MFGGGVELRVWERRQVRVNAFETQVMLLNCTGRFGTFGKSSPSKVRFQLILAGLFDLTVCNTVSRMGCVCTGRVHVDRLSCCVGVFS